MVELSTFPVLIRNRLRKVTSKFHTRKKYISIVLFVNVSATATTVLDFLPAPELKLSSVLSRKSGSDPRDEENDSRVVPQKLQEPDTCLDFTDMEAPF